MGEDYTTIDLDAKNIPSEIIDNALTMSNNTIRKGLKVEEIFTSYDDAKNSHLRRVISEKLKGLDKIRLIKIGEFDINACGGFHVKNTCKIGSIQIIKKEKMKSNLTRIYFIAGERVDNYFNILVNITDKLSHIFKLPLENLPKRGEELIDINKNLKTRINELSNMYAEKIEKELPYKKINGYMIKFYEGDENVISNLLKISKNQDILILKTADRYTITSQKINIREIIKEITSTYKKTKGGGGKMQGSLKSVIPMETILDFISEYITKRG